jgi:hypothetical protein
VASMQLGKVMLLVYVVGNAVLMMLAANKPILAIIDSLLYTVKLA